jgi:hypothetical protein
MEGRAIAFVLETSPEHRAGMGVECHLLWYRFWVGKVQRRISMRGIGKIAGMGELRAAGLELRASRAPEVPLIPF